MTKQQKHDEVSNAMDVIKDKENPIYIIKDNCNKEIKDLLLKIIYDDNIGGKNLGYELCYRAIGIIENQSIDELDDLRDLDIDEASPYTSNRLGYLNIFTEGEISEIINEYNCGIGDACAIWYNNMVQDVMMMLVDFIQG